MYMKYDTTVQTFPASVSSIRVVTLTATRSVCFVSYKVITCTSFMEAFSVLLEPTVMQRVKKKSSKVSSCAHLYATPEKYPIQNRFC